MKSLQTSTTTFFCYDRFILNHKSTNAVGKRKGMGWRWEDDRKHLFQKEATVVDVPDDTNDDDDDIHMIETETVAPRNGAEKMFGWKSP